MLLSNWQHVANLKGVVFEFGVCEFGVFSCEGGWFVKHGVEKKKEQTRWVCSFFGNVCAVFVTSRLSRGDVPANSMQSAALLRWVYLHSIPTLGWRVADLPRP